MGGCAPRPAVARASTPTLLRPVSQKTCERCEDKPDAGLFGQRREAVCRCGQAERHGHSSRTTPRLSHSSQTPEASMPLRRAGLLPLLAVLAAVALPQAASAATPAKRAVKVNVKVTKFITD